MYQAAQNPQTLSGRILGHQDGSSAPAGEVGEFVSAQVALNSVSLSNNAQTFLLSAPLSAGDWDVDGTVFLTFGATTNYTRLAAWLTLQPGTPGGPLGASINTLTDGLASGTTSPASTGALQFNTAHYQLDAQGGVVPNGQINLVLPRQRMLISPQCAPLPVGIVVLVQFTVSTVNMGGIMQARRMR